MAGSTGGVSKAAKGQGSAEKEEQTGNQKRARRQWESWSAEDKNSFFEGLYEVRACIFFMMRSKYYFFSQISSNSPSIFSSLSPARLSASLVCSTGKTLKQSRITLPWSTRKEANQLTWWRTRSRSAIFTTEPGTRYPNTLTLPTVSCPLSLSTTNKRDFIDYMWTINNSSRLLFFFWGYWNSLFLFYSNSQYCLTTNSTVRFKNIKIYIFLSPYSLIVFSLILLYLK